MENCFDFFFYLFLIKLAKGEASVCVAILHVKHKKVKIGDKFLRARKLSGSFLIRRKLSQRNFKKIQKNAKIKKKCSKIDKKSSNLVFSALVK